MKSDSLTALDYHNQLGLIPSDRVIRRAKTPYYGVIHFGLSTFTNIDGFGSESPEYFNPTDFDPLQICSTCKAAGMQGLVIVCKHHDGFCLWPTETTDYNISRSPYKNGQGDIVGELVAACRKTLLEVGIYISTWDRNNAAYGKPEYPEIYRQQIREICTRYGKLTEFWIDGLSGGPGWYGGAREIRTVTPDYFQWNETIQLVRYLQPKAVICSDFGPDLRWVGNTMGFADENICSQYTPQSTIPGMEALPGNVDDSCAASGHFDGKYFMPFQAPVPLRRNWYYHPKDDGRQRSVTTLINIYLNTVGLGGHLALGVSPDTTGKICEEDCKILTEFGTALKEMFRHMTLRSWGRVTRREFHIIKIDRMIFFNLIKIKEDLRLGEMVRAYALDVMQDGKWVELFRGRSVGFQRIRNIKSGRANQIRIRFLKRDHANRTPLGLEVRCYVGPKKLLEAATGYTEYLTYGKHEALTGGEITGKVCTWTLPKVREVGGIAYRANFPADGGTVSKYRLHLQYKFDGEWETVSEGEFLQVDLNPIPHEIKFTPRRVYAIKLEAVETIDDAARKLSFQECRILYGKEPESIFPLF